jgi:uncharacterized membrane protein
VPQWRALPSIATSDPYIWLKLVHVIGACVLFGTGLRSGDPATIASTAGVVVLADMVFTASAVILQPLTGAALAHVMGYSLREPWIVVSFGLYLMDPVTTEPSILAAHELHR